MPNTEKLLFSTFLLALLFLAFAVGGAAVHYDWKLTRFLSDSLESADAWYQSMQESEEEKKLDALDANNRDPVGNSVVSWDEKKAYNGYTLVSVRKLQSVFLVDMEGKVVYRWKVEPEEIAGAIPAGFNPRVYIGDALALPNGNLIAGFMMRGYSPYGLGIAMIDKNSKVIWSSTQKHHHDVYRDPDTGNIYTLTHEFIKNVRKEHPNLPRKIMNDYIVILSAEGKQLDKISLLDAFIDTPFEPQLYYNVPDKAAWDKFHTNSVVRLSSAMARHFPMFKEGQLLLSIRNMSALAVLDPDTRKIVWMKYGPWHVQHSAHFLSNGNLLLFDNEAYTVGRERFSRIYEVNPNTTATTWHYKGTPKEPFYTSTHGRVQRLANGNTLINEANNGRLFEVTPAGEIVWNYQLPGKRGFDYAPVTIFGAARYSAEELPFLQSE